MKYNDSQVKERIFKKTKELITTRGVKGWNMNRLAKESGIAKNTLYRIIDSKEKLILEVILRDLKQVEQELNSILMSGDESIIIDQISKLISKNIAHYLGGYLNEALLEYPKLEEQVQANEESIRNATIMFLKIGQMQNQLRKDVDALTVFEAMMGMVLHYVRLGYTADELAEKISTSFSYILDGIKEKK